MLLMAYTRSDILVEEMWIRRRETGESHCQYYGQKGMEYVSRLSLAS